jgi:tetratricopeptide (TPR) repeat protein
LLLVILLPPFLNAGTLGLPGQTPPAQTSEKELGQAETLIRQGKLDEAIALLDSLVQKEAKLPGLEAKLGKAYYTKRNFRQATLHFKAALQLDPGDRETIQLLGLSFYSLGQFQEAIPLLEKIQSQLPPTEFDGVYLLAVSYLRTLQLEKARATFAQLFSVMQDSPAAHLLFAQMMVRQRLEDEAIPELQKAVTLDPRLPMVHFLLGEIFLFKSNAELALEEFKKELAINPTLWLVYWRLGDTLTRLERYADAEQVLKKAIWLNETFSGSYVLLGQIGLKKGDLELALGFLERGAKMDPNNYLAHYLLGQTYQRLGLVEQANRQFELAKSLLAEGKNAQQQLLSGTLK